MPGTPTTGSTNIAILDSQIVASLCLGKFFVDVTPSVYIGDGAENVLGANVEILNPFGIIVKPYGANYEIAPGLSGGMDAVIAFNIPTQAGNYQYGKYTVNVQLFDEDGTSWIVTKSVTICEPDVNNKTRKYGSLSAKMKANCVDGKLFVFIDTLPAYRGKLVESQSLTGTLDYPTASGLDPLSINTGVFAVILFEGVYKLTGENCATYNMGDHVYVDVLYKIKKEHNARCLIDECCVYGKFEELHRRKESDCSQAEKDETASILLESIALFTTAKLAGNCGEDPSEFIDQLEKLLGCKCTCNCNEGAPIVNNEPSGDVIIEGCNVSVVTNGLTKTYTIDNYAYEVSIAENGGALTAADPTLEGCTYTQLITFNISTVYAQIKGLAAPGNESAANTEGDFWASVVNKALRNVDPACLGIAAEQWKELTFAEKFTAMVTKFCACCGSACEATVENQQVTVVGNDVHLTWEGNADWYEVYMDGVLQNTYLNTAAVADVFTHIFVGEANGVKHDYVIIPYCADDTKGTPVTDDFEELGCPSIAAPVGESSITAACPFDLTSIDYSPAAGLIVEWHNANNTLPASIIANPLAVLGGVYYAFFKDENGCYSSAKQVSIFCTETGNCSAPQNLEVVVFGIYNFFVKFQSAAYPPPSNSYTVKRRLASDPDVGGSYTTIGTPVWNASLNRWVIADETAVNDTLYVYKAISNCGETEPSISVNYVKTTCPTAVIYPTDTTIAYSFVPPAGPTSIIVQLLDNAGTSIIHIDTYSSPFDNPIVGLFEYLTPSTTYKFRIVLFYGGEEYIFCNFQNITTDEEIPD